MVTEFLHWGALLPLALWGLLHRSAPRGSGWIAVAFGVSWLGDLLAVVAGGGWYPSLLWLPLQCAAGLMAVCSHRQTRHVVFVGLGLLTAWNMYSQTGPEVVVTATGSLAIVAACWERAHPMALPALIYWGLGSTCYLMLVAMIEGGGSSGFWWWAYQGVRVLAWAAFAAILVRAWRARAVLARAVRERMIGMLREGTA